MGLFKKRGKKSELPELPELPGGPELPRLPEMTQELDSQEVSGLPSFPENKMGNDLSHYAIKSAVSPLDLPPIEPKEKKTLEISEPLRIAPLPPIHQPLMPPSLIPSPQPQISLPPQPRITQPKIKEPVYIRIDKFKSAISSFQEIHNKILEIEDLFRGIKELKQREDTELREWEREIETLKMRIDGINQNIFSKIN